MKDGILRTIYREIFPPGLSIMYGRSGVGKSRIAYSIADQFGEEAMLVTPVELAERENVHPYTISSDVHDTITLIRLASIMKAKYIVVDSMSRMDKRDMIENISKMNDMGKTDDVRFIFTAQIRVTPSTGRIYIHNIYKRAESECKEVVELVAVSKNHDYVETLITCRLSGKRIAIRVPRNKPLQEPDMLTYLKTAWNITNDDEVVAMVSKAIMCGTKKSRKISGEIRW